MNESNGKRSGAAYGEERVLGIGLADGGYDRFGDMPGGAASPQTWRWCLSLVMRRPNSRA